MRNENHEKQKIDFLKMKKTRSRTYEEYYDDNEAEEEA